VLLATESARERWGDDLTEADLQLTLHPPRGLPHPSDAISGGTLQSLAAAAGGDDAATATDPAALITDPARAAEVRRRSPISVRPRRADGAVIAPMLPAAFINPAVIQRTAALLAADGEGPGAPPPRYREGVVLGGPPLTLPLRVAVAGTLAGTQATVARIARAAPPVRRPIAGALSRVLPGSGFGPAGNRLEGWRWRMELRARTTGGRELRAEVDADGHPGYLATARMLGEAGLLLADPALTPERSGCLTPAAALGSAHVDRFDRAGVRFSIPA
jgi:short subunit dehydrogenase-like uncharacterized protein